MEKYIFSKIKNKNAQDMIEFTLVLPILMFIFLFILTGGQMIFNKQVAFNMAYQGCRVAVTCRQSEAEAKARERASEFIGQTIAVESWDIECGLAPGMTVKNPDNPTSTLTISPSTTWTSFKQRKYSWGTIISGSQFCETKVTLNMNTLFPIRGIINSQMPISAKTRMVIEYNPGVNYNKSMSGVDLPS